MLKIIYGSQFKKDFKRIKKQGLRIEKLQKVIQTLAYGKELSPKYHDHPLIGNYHGFRELHIEPNWLLIYKIDEDRLILALSRTGSHSALFD